MLTPHQITQFQQKNITIKTLAIIEKRSERTIYRWKKVSNLSKKRVGRKRKSGHITYLRLFWYILKNNSVTQQGLADYLYRELKLKLSKSTICRILKRKGITYKKGAKWYSEKNLTKIKQFIKDNYLTFLSPSTFAIDECGFNLGEVPHYAYSLKGYRARIERPGKRGLNHTLLLCVQNANGKGVVHWKLIEGGAKAKDFHDFISNIKFSTDDKKCIFLDNALIHRAVKACQKLGLSTIKELATSRNIELIYLPPYTPELNPVEYLFNIIRKYVESRKPRTYQKLELVISEIIEKLQQKNLTKTFQHCLEKSFETKQPQPSIFDFPKRGKSDAEVLANIRFSRSEFIAMNSSL